MKKLYPLTKVIIFAIALNTSLVQAAGLVVSGDSTLQIETATLEISNDVDLSGMLIATTGVITIGGNWTDDSKFIAGNSTVNLNGSGTTQILSGTSTFYKFIENNAIRCFVRYVNCKHKW